MQIIFFNIWHGRNWKGLKKFITAESSKTDIFCFLEVDPALEKKLEAILPGFNPIYYSGIKTAYLNGIIEGRSIFVKKGIGILESKSLNLYKVRPADAGGFQYVKLEIGNQAFLIGEIHGKARPGTKKDTPIRLAQSQKIIEFFKDKKEPKIIGGDFNLYPDTKSIKMFEEAGYRNLIKEFKIDSTRNRLSWEQFDTIQHFADYCLTSPEIKVLNFEVPKIEISDHLPLILDFDLPAGKAGI